MNQEYNLGEILKIAVEVEKNGKDLYGVLALESQNEQIEKIWLYLKQQEAEHEKFFQSMLDAQSDYLISEFSSGDHQAYIRAIASEYIFTEDLIKKHIKKKFESDIEAIEFGISIEKISILTYSGLREYIKKDKQPALDKVIQEEKKHLTQLKQLRRSVSQT